MRHKYFYLICLLLLTVPALNANAARLSVLFSGSSSSVTFAGYTGLYNGNLGGVKGANQKCATDYPGSRVCLFDDILKLGANYPYTYDVWWIDGVTGWDSTSGAGSKLGGGTTGTGGGGTCGSWTQSGVSYGLIFTTSGTSSGSSTCAGTARIACCK